MADRKRCAIYTRKSTEEGLEQAFNSLDAQREACAAYVMSQAHEGWELGSELYDDGGWSGGNMDRPGLQQLLADVEAGKVDVIVVYKVDRLTRNLADFARIVDKLDKADASFVSVTQAFNTTTSMGRLTLNVLLSFAQFEREVTGERIRDKVAASKRKGMWMGGPVPFGYHLGERKLLPHPKEAPQVRLIFEHYIVLRSISALAEDLAGRGIKTKLRTYRDGQTKGGIHFTKGPLALLLKNPIYLGKVRHDGELYEGEHEQIVPQDIFDQAQAVFAANGQERMLGKRFKHPSLLTGILTDPGGRPMTPVHTRKGSRQYRYYATRLAIGESKDAAWRVPAGDLEKAVIRLFVQWLKRSPCDVEQQQAGAVEEKRKSRNGLASDLPQMAVPEQRRTLLDLGVKASLTEDSLTLSFHGKAKSEQISLPARLVHRGSELKLAIPPDGQGAINEPDPVLLKLIAKARAAQEVIITGKEHPAVSDYGKRHLWQLLRISWLAPDILSAIVEGRQPASLTGRQLLRATSIPLGWDEQRKFFGFT
jgi:site-specific DNA recombinase